ncbi:MAG: hypothetical protein KGZ50_05210 [Peptococcaceae bacterium]|nr:hypothetical protein [Peptococcaceae bacterium]
MKKLPVLLLVVVLMTVSAGCRPRTVGRVHDSNILTLPMPKGRGFLGD